MSTDSYENSTEELDPRDLRRLLRNLRDALVVLAEWTQGLAEGVYEAVHIALNNIAFAEELVTLRFDSEVQKQIQALPGNPPSVKL